MYKGPQTPLVKGLLTFKHFCLLRLLVQTLYICQNAGTMKLAIMATSFQFSIQLKVR